VADGGGAIKGTEEEDEEERVEGEEGEDEAKGKEDEGEEAEEEREEEPSSSGLNLGAGALGSDTAASRSIFSGDNDRGREKASWLSNKGHANRDG